MSDSMYASIALDFTKADLDVVCDHAVRRYVVPRTVFERRLAVHAGDGLHAAARPPSQFLLPKYQALFKFLKSTTRWQPANPNKLVQLAKIRDSYLSLTVLPSDESLNIANYCGIDGIFRFESAITAHPYILLNGVRGIGKTAFLNYWLSTRTRELEQKQFTWFRIDASKVHRFWNASTGTPVSDAYINYFRLHTLYVLLLYGGRLAHGLDSSLAVEAHSELFRDVCNSLHLSHKSEMNEVRNIFAEELIKHANGDPTRDISVDTIFGILRVRPSRERRTISQLFSAACEAFRKRRVQVLVMIDGIDNIAWTKRNKFYLQTCGGFGKILTSLKHDIGDGMRVILAARPETVSEIRFVHPGIISDFNNTESEPPFVEWRIVPPPITEIVQKKIDAALASSFARERQDCEQELGDEAHSLRAELLQLSSESKSYPADIVKGIGSSYAKGSPSSYVAMDQAEVLKVLFDDDVRGYIDNVTKVYLTRKHVFGDRPLTERVWQARILQYMLLNGRPFFDSREHYLEKNGTKSRANFQDRGSVFPNLFWWPIELTSGVPDHWHGLTGIRVLQFANHLQQFSIGDLLRSLKVLFGYSDVVLIEIIETFVACGMIDIETMAAEGGVFDDENRGTVFDGYSGIAFLTDKGRFFLEYIWRRPDVLYYYALETPLHARLTTSDTKYVRACREFASLKFVEDFYMSAIPTVAVFLLHIRHFSKVEEQSTSEKLESEPKIKHFLGGDHIDIVQILRLPWDDIDAAYKNFVLTGLSSHRNKSKVKEIREQIEGVLRLRSAAN